MALTDGSTWIATPVRLASEYGFLPLAGKYKRGVRLVNTLQPYFTPVRIYTSWTKQAIVAEASAARYALEDDAITAYLAHFTVFLINEPLYPPEYPKRPAAIRYHFHVKGQAPIFPIRIDGGHDFVPRADLYQFTWLKVQHRGRCGSPCASPDIRV